MNSPIPPTWSWAMRSAELSYWVSVARYLRDTGKAWSARRAAGIAGVDPTCVSRRLKLPIVTDGKETAGQWLKRQGWLDNVDDWDPPPERGKVLP